MDIGPVCSKSRFSEIFRKLHYGGTIAVFVIGGCQLMGCKHSYYGQHRMTY
jgi:hypothetical protein